MVLNIVTACLVCLMNFGLGSAVETTQQVACLAREDCSKQSQALSIIGVSNFFAGNYAVSGCYYKDNTAYFGTGGSIESMSETSLPGGNRRIWCESNLSTITAPTFTPPLSVTQFPTIELPTPQFTAPTYTPPLTLAHFPAIELPILTSKPSLVPSVSPTEEKHCIDIEVVTDKYGEESGFSLSMNPDGGFEPEKLVEYPIGNLNSETTYSERFCVAKGKYIFTIQDTFGGICCTDGNGSYSVRIDGREIANGGANFQNTNIITHDINVGFEPDMSDDEKLWLDGHNARRSAFHEQHNTEIRLMKWSPELANDASDRVDQISLSCKVIPDATNEEGENIAVRKFHVGSKDTESPDNILKRWSDLKLKKGYPENRTMTQVMWRATGYLGCSSKVTQYDDGKYCYVSVCRYLRPGNCSVGSYTNWLDATLSDRTPCGKMCPGEGCH